MSKYRVKKVFTVQPKFLGRFERFFAAQMRIERITLGLKKAGIKSVMYLTKRSQGIKYLGRFRAGWRFDVDRPGWLAIYNRTGHAIYVEKGRRPGAAKPPILPIMLWCIDHGMDANAAFPIRAAIAKRGIKPRPVLTSPGGYAHVAGIVEDELVSYLDQVLAKSSKRSAMSRARGAVSRRMRKLPGAGTARRAFKKVFG